MGSASTPKRGYSGQHSGRGVRCQSEADCPGRVFWVGRHPNEGLAVVLRTEARSESWPLGFHPCRGVRQTMPSTRSLGPAD